MRVCVCACVRCSEKHRLAYLGNIEFKIFYLIEADLILCGMGRN